MKYIISSLVLIFVVVGCASVDMPKGTHEGYSSARFIRADSPNPDLAESSDIMNAIIQNAIAGVVQKSGMDLRNDDADLLIAYLLLIQDNVSTTTISDHFGYGRDKGAISDLAHKKGVIQGNRQERYEASAIVIDIIDADTNELIYRNFAKRDVLQDITDDERIARVRSAVGEALADFFQ